MLDKIKFLEMLTSIVEIAKTQENTLAQDEIKSYFNEIGRASCRERVFRPV